MLTQWGYEINGDELPPALAYGDALIPSSVAAFGEEIVESTIDAATDMARNYCGWHVCPSLTCTAELTADGSFVRLPAAFVADVTSVTDNGTAVEFEFLHNGLVRRSDGYPFSAGWGAVTVEYVAGYDDPRGFASVIAQMATNALAVTPGVRQEGIGNASKTYNSPGGEVGGVALGDRAKACLATYRVMPNAS